MDETISRSKQTGSCFCHILVGIFHENKSALSEQVGFFILKDSVTMAIYDVCQNEAHSILRNSMFFYQKLTNYCWEKYDFVSFAGNIPTLSTVYAETWKTTWKVSNIKTETLHKEKNFYVFLNFFHNALHFYIVFSENYRPQKKNAIETFF